MRTAEPDYDSGNFPPPDEDADEADEVRSLIDTLMQLAATPDEWLKICQLCKSIGDEPPFRTWRAFGWHASRPDWDLGIPIGSGKTEAEAIADLLEREDNA